MAQQYRAKFSDNYAQPCRPWRYSGGFRLMDFNTLVLDVEPGRVPAQPGPGEFCVFDKTERQIGYFEWNEKFDADKVHGVIEGHFGFHAVRIFDQMWVV